MEFPVTVIVREKSNIRIAKRRGDSHSNSTERSVPLSEDHICAYAEIESGTTTIAFDPIVVFLTTMSVGREIETTTMMDSSAIRDST